MKGYWFQKSNVVEMLIRKRLSILYEGKNKQFLMVTKNFQRNRVKKTYSAHKRIIREKDAKEIKLYIIFY